MMKNSGNIKPKKGFHKIKLEYYFNQRFTDLKLFWSSHLFKKRLVGNKFLFPSSGVNISR